MAIARSSIIKGPGTAQHGSNPVIYSAGDIQSGMEIAQGDVPTAMFGTVDTFPTDRIGKTTLTPAGQVTANMITALYPHLNPTVGASVFGTSDTALKIHSRAGVLLTWLAAAVTKMPDLILSPRKTAFGSMEYTSVLKNNGNPADSNSYYTTASTAWSDATLATADIKRLVYAAAFGDVLASIITADGWVVSFDVRLQPVPVDDIGTTDMYIASVSALARCVPVNLTEADILTAMRIQDTGAALGTSNRRNKDLALTASGLTVTLKDAALIRGGMRWGSTVLRGNELGFVAHRTESSGTFGAIATIAVS